MELTKNQSWRPVAFLELDCFHTQWHLLSFTVSVAFLNLCWKRVDALLGVVMCFLGRRLRTRRWSFQGLFLLTTEHWEERRTWMLSRQMMPMAMIWVYGSFWKLLGLAWRTFHVYSRRANEGAMKMNVEWGSESYSDSYSHGNSNCGLGSWAHIGN